MLNSQKTSSLVSFDEQKYLELNPDVASAVVKGEFLSGLYHFLSYGYYEKRDGGVIKIDIKVQNLLESIKDITLPPPHLRIRVHSEDISTYKSIGKSIAFDIHFAIESYSADLTKDSRILDFGCGCGRVISWLNYLYDDSYFYGTDIDKEAISWCQNNLFEISDFSVNENTPPFIYPDNYFSCIYSISVFTHLPEDMQFEWLKELHRVTKKNGLLMLSVHGEQLFPDSHHKLKKQFIGNGFFYSVDQEGTDGLPDFYQTTFHTEDYIKSKWSKFFTIVDIIKNGVANHQDLVICRKI